MILKDIPKNNRYLFLDMNSFFARVEQQVQPDYRGKPICVSPYTGDSGCVISASYEAKALGIPGVCRVKQAKSIYPKIIILPARPHLYRFYHDQIVQRIYNFTPFIQVLSIDEFSICLSGQDGHYQEARKIAFGLKSAIQKEVGDWLTCSIGIGPNQFLAKIAGELKKPDGLFEITLENLEEIYNKMKLTDLTGINYRMEKRLNYANIYTPMDFYQKSLPELSRHLGIMGKVWYYRLRGFEIEQLAQETKTIGHSHVLPPELRSQKGAEKVIIKLIEKIGYRLRQGGYWATYLSLGIGYLGHLHWHKVKKISPCNNNRQLIKFALDFFAQSPTQKPFSIYLTTGGLIKNHIQSISLFDNFRKSDYLSRAMDKINDKYGATTIQSAALAGTSSVAPDRIPFGRPRFEIRNM
ncbi:MAG: hypothetical protein Q7S37_01045 [bacterium]|nr:hypothetical protein [bacterium]